MPKTPRRSSVPTWKVLLGVAFFGGAVLSLHLTANQFRSSTDNRTQANTTAEVLGSNTPTPTYYVDCQNGADTKSGRTAADAWKTLDPVRVAQLVPGDVLGFKKNCSWDTGMQDGQVVSNLGLVITANGTENAPITLTSYGEGAQPRFFNTYREHIYVRGLEIRGDWVVVDDLAISEVPEYAVLVNETAEHVTLQRLTISGTGMGIVIRGPHTKALQNTITDLKMIVNSNDGGDNDYGATAFVIASSNNELGYNTVKRAIAPSYDYKVDGGALDFFGYDNFTQITNNYIHHNWVEDSDGFFEIGSTNGAVLSNNRFSYNVLVNNGAIMTVHLGGTWGTQVSGLQFTNNTSYERTSEWSYPTLRQNWRLLRFDQAPTDQTLLMANNIFVANGVQQFSTHGSFQRSHNLYDLTNSSLGYTLAETELSLPAQLSNPTQKQFQLTVSSPAKDTGVYLNQTTDFAGIAVPQGNGVDRGAYELLAGATPSGTPVPTATPRATPTTPPTVTPSPSVSPSPTPLSNVVPAFTTTKLATPRVGQAYSQTVVALDKNTGDVLNMTANKLPAGLSLGSCTQAVTPSGVELSCRISGTPTTAGQSDINLTVKDQLDGATTKNWRFKVN